MFRGKKNSTNQNTFIHNEAGAFILNVDSHSLEYLVETVKSIRPIRVKDINEAEIKFRSYLFQLQQDKSILFSLRKALLSQVRNSNLVPALIDSGMLSERGFIQEFTSKIKHKILPALIRSNDFLFVINKVFFNKHDHIWVEGISTELWENFFSLLGLRWAVTDELLSAQLLQAMQILSIRLATLGLEKEITRQYNSIDEAFLPFAEQARLVNRISEKKNSFSSLEERKKVYVQLHDILDQCSLQVMWIRKHGKEHATSLAQTYILTRMQQTIERLLILADVLDADKDFNNERFIHYFVSVVRYENRKTSLQEFLSQSFELLAYQVVEHKEKKGVKYITATRNEFMKIFKRSLAGGFIVSFIAIFKNLLSFLQVAPFVKGFFYSINYSFGFVLMDITGSTLATKQPAYTASSLVASLDEKKIGSKPNLYNLSVMVARTARTQIASFAGNLLIVFPLTYLLAFGYAYLTGEKIVSGIAAEKLLQDQHPWQSLALLYACFTGFFLFLSGLIAGYVENHIEYGNIVERLRQHSKLQNHFSAKSIKRIGNFIHKYGGALSGSIALGFFLGTAGLIGKFIGIPYDIRHITISAGNVAIAFYGLNYSLSGFQIFIAIGGVLMIGLLNFLVSFSLAFYVALKSRGIRLKDYPELIGILWRHFKKWPLDFIRPPKQPRSETHLEESIG